MKRAINSFAFLMFASVCFADYSIDWYTIDGGGGQSTGGPYILTGTIGQPDAAYSAGGQYELLGGFWPGGPLCFVDFYSFARFAEWWLETGTGQPDCQPTCTRMRIISSTGLICKSLFMNGFIIARIIGS